MNHENCKKKKYSNEIKRIIYILDCFMYFCILTRNIPVLLTFLITSSYWE